MIGRKYKHIPTGNIWEYKETIVLENKQKYVFISKDKNEVYTWNIGLSEFYEMVGEDSFVRI